jgi:hypothetical protein
VDVEYMHICDYAFTAEGGKACIIGIFDQVRATSFPATQAYMVAAIRLTGTPHESGDVRVEIGRPNGDVVTGATAHVTITAEGYANLNCNFVTIQFPSEGRYTFKVSTGGKTLATTSIRVLKVAQNPNQAPSAPSGRPVH